MYIVAVVPLPKGYFSKFLSLMFLVLGIYNFEKSVSLIFIVLSIGYNFVSRPETYLESHRQLRRRKLVGET